MSKEYILKLNEKQIEILKKSLDFISRLQIGQISEIRDTFNSPLSDRINEENKNSLRENLIKIKKDLFPELHEENAYFSIYNKQKSPENARIAYDIYQVIRYTLAYDKNPKGGTTVDFNEVFPASSEEPPKLEIKKN
jgi:hypothetical protein